LEKWVVNISGRPSLSGLKPHCRLSQVNSCLLHLLLLLPDPVDINQLDSQSYNPPLCHITGWWFKENDM